MKALLPGLAAVVLLPLLQVPALADEHWEIQYRYRQADSTLTINDLTFPDAKRGIACGFTTDRKDKDRPLVMFTADGGTQWNEIPVKETCLSLFFLEDSFGWMVTDSGIWSTAEGGRTWVKIKGSPAGMLRVWFLDHDRGFVVGREKKIFETKDGGTTWAPLAIASTAAGDPLYTTWGDIAFSGNMGMITGWNIPPRRGGPDWMEANANRPPVQQPHLTVMLQTKTGGNSWIKSEASLFGQVTRVSLSSLNMGLGLVEFKDLFDYPSEVYRINLTTGKNDLAYREKNRAITDVRLFPNSTRAFLVGYETTGPVYRTPIPGKLKVLSSNDTGTWTEMTVDYRAVAHSAILTGPDDKHVWIATDTGMILKLEQ